MPIVSDAAVREIEKQIQEDELGEAKKKFTDEQLMEIIRPVQEAMNNGVKYGLINWKQNGKIMDFVYKTLGVKQP